MKKLTHASYASAWIAMLALPLAAQQACGGDETETGPTPTTTPTTTAPACPGTQTLCNDLCVDITTDEANCGSCNNACRADQDCTASACVCPTGREDCGTSCSNTLTDPNNCGTCGNICGQGEQCINGSCQCPSGGQRCGDACVDWLTDEQHCGGCDQPCATAQTCIDGDCECPEGRDLCGAECVDLQADPRYCGDCATDCNDDEFCDQGDCATINNCADVPADSYEANETCGQARPLTNAVENAGTVSVGDATLHHQDASPDTDWYAITAEEGWHGCVLVSQCYFYFEISLTPPAGEDHSIYEMCLHYTDPEGTCDDMESIGCLSEDYWVAAEGHYAASVEFEGFCGLEDWYKFFVEVKRTGGEQACTPYQLEYQYIYTDGECP